LRGINKGGVNVCTVDLDDVTINCFEDMVDIQTFVDLPTDEFPGQICMALTILDIDKEENLKFGTDYFTDVIDDELMKAYKNKIKTTN
jgi:hypothetical protein